MSSLAVDRSELIIALKLVGKTGKPKAKTNADVWCENSRLHIALPAMRTSLPGVGGFDESIRVNASLLVRLADRMPADHTLQIQVADGYLKVNTFSLSGAIISKPDAAPPLGPAPAKTPDRLREWLKLQAVRTDLPTNLKSRKLMELAVLGRVGDLIELNLLKVGEPLAMDFQKRVKAAAGSLGPYGITKEELERIAKTTMIATLLDEMEGAR